MLTFKDLEARVIESLVTFFFSKIWRIKVNDEYQTSPLAWLPEQKKISIFIKKKGFAPT